MTLKDGSKHIARPVWDVWCEYLQQWDLAHTAEVTGVDAEKIEVSEEECEEEYKKLADSYKMELDKVKELLPLDGMKGDLQVRKAAKLIAESAVAVAPKAEEKAE